MLGVTGAHTRPLLTSSGVWSSVAPGMPDTKGGCWADLRGSGSASSYLPGPSEPHPHPCGELRCGVRQGRSLGLTENWIIFATHCTPQPLWGLRWKGVGSSGVQQIPFKLNRHTPTPLSGCRILAGVLGSSGRMPPQVGEASGVLVVLSLCLSPRWDQRPRCQDS